MCEIVVFTCSGAGESDEWRELCHWISVAMLNDNNTYKKTLEHLECNTDKHKCLFCTNKRLHITSAK